MIIAGLTGSIATGKSTVGMMFQSLDVPVYEADKLVHQLYAGPEARQIEKLFPGTLVDGQIDRKRLGQLVLNDPAALEKLQNTIHPLVRQKLIDIAKAHRKKNTPLIIFDIPLLLEKGRNFARQSYGVDKIIVTYCAPEIQKARALVRATMTEEKFLALLALQLPQSEKRDMADFTLDTGKSLEITQAEVEAILAKSITSNDSKS